MKRLNFILLLVVVMLVSSTLSAQQINGDMNHNNRLDVSDVTLLLEGYLSGKAEVISADGLNPFYADNSLIVGTWYMSSTDSIVFRADGTTDYADGYTYEFIPLQGGILFYNAAGVPVDVFKVYKATADCMVVVPNGRAEVVVYIRTAPTSPDDDTPGPAVVEEHKAIAFQFQDKTTAVTRASRRKAPALNDREYGVFACYTQGERVSTASTLQADLMNNVEVWHDGADWTYAPVKYWPQRDGGDSYVSFFAYSPYSGSNGAVSVSQGAAAPVVNYQTIDPFDDSADLLYGNLLNATQQSNDGLVKIETKHALSRLNFSAVFDGSIPSDTKVTVQSIAISGRIPFRDSFNLLTEKWGGTTAETETAYTVGGNHIAADVLDRGSTYAAQQPEGVLAYSKPVCSSPLLLIPTTEALSITITYFITTDDAHLSQGYSRIENRLTKVFPATLQPGRSYDILFSLGLTSVRLWVTSSAWEDTYLPAVVPLTR